tara:strand:- start:616 stop:1098 length:483 start_codon:yes stop_codon:yes gene_type:complete
MYYIIILTTLSLLFFKYDGVSVLKDCGKSLVNSKQRLVKLKFKISMMYMAVQVMFQVFYLSLYQKFMFNNVKKIDRKTYEVVFTINGKVFKFRIKPTRGPSIILQAIDDKDTDVTTTLEPYINFSSSKIVDITPRDFQMKNVNIEYFSGENKTIENNCKL